MASVASQLIEEVTAYAQSDSLEYAREICVDGTYFPNNLSTCLPLLLNVCVFDHFIFTACNKQSTHMHVLISTMLKFSLLPLRFRRFYSSLSIYYYHVEV